MKTWKNLLTFGALLALPLMAVVPAGAQMLGRRPVRNGGLVPPRSANSGPATSGPTWSLLFPTAILDERFATSAVYDGPTNSMIVFGGGSLTSVKNDVMALSNANGVGTGTWTTVIPDGEPGSPAARDFHTAVYDAVNSRMIVFGGCTFTGEFCTTLQNDVWVLTNANGQEGAPAWVELAPTGSLPAGRWGHAAAYDPASNRMIAYGGDNGSATFSDVWVLTNANGLGGTPAWTRLSPSGGLPTGQDAPSVVYDPADNVLIEFAGTKQGFTSDTNSVWTLSHANGLGGTPVWTNLIANGAVGSPPKRDGHTAVFDSTNNRMTIFGGNNNTATGFPQLNDVWVLANASGLRGTPQWTKLNPAGTKPGGRTEQAGVYDPADNRLIIYGGGSWDANFFSTWVLTGANGLP